MSDATIFKSDPDDYVSLLTKFEPYIVNSYA